MGRLQAELADAKRQVRKTSAFFFFECVYSRISQNQELENDTKRLKKQTADLNDEMQQLYVMNGQLQHESIKWERKVTQETTI